ncbi:hypothetical protein NC653_026665 [Populus alba x Populus x berolinensis]|uniref:Uncharacterized protein n=1 Tax=Populus alba x Populus x berolinensis TaxID=444605 RepID=A0AAD6MEZ9_9ROSI|nr:hypothetical protein NC653_026665 [Populus alba x Populus x berolinensis]
MGEKNDEAVRAAGYYLNTTNEAGDHLSKAMIGCVLGNCIWKMARFTFSKNSLQSCTKHKLLRKAFNMPRMRSIWMSRMETLDKPWNCYALTSFFVTGAWDHSKLLQSLKAYQNAEKDEEDGVQSRPIIQLVNHYLENYERGLLVGLKLLP